MKQSEEERIGSGKCRYFDLITYAIIFLLFDIHHDRFLKIPIASVDDLSDGGRRRAYYRYTRVFTS